MIKDQNPYLKTQGLIVVLTVIAIFMGYHFVKRNFFSNPSSFQEAASTEEQSELSEEQIMEESKKKSRLELEQHISKLIFAPVVVTNEDLPATVTDFLSKYEVGGVTLFGSDISTQSATSAINLIKETSNDSIAIAVDHEGGVVQRFSGDGFSKLPSWYDLCEKSRVERKEALTQSYKELTQVGVNMIFAPVLDLYSEKSAISNRACSSDLETVVSSASDAIDVAQSEGLIPVVKHYPGLQGVLKDTHDDFAVVEVSKEQLLAFSRILEVFKVPVMVAHVGIEGKDITRPCTVYPDCVGAVLRQFPGIITFTDALEMKAALYSPDGNDKTLEQVSKEALLAGNSILVYGKDVAPDQLESIIKAIADEYESSQMFAGLVDDAVEKSQALFVVSLSQP